MSQDSTSQLRPRWLVASIPTIWFLLAYLLTTVIAAVAYALLPNGWSLAETVGVMMPTKVVADIGSATYFWLLLLPLFVVPFSACAAILAARYIIDHGFKSNFGTSLYIGRAALLCLCIISFSYCTYRLHQLHALNFGVFDCGSVNTKLLTRMSLLSNLGYVYFAFAYGVNMMLPVLAYIAYNTQGRHIADRVIFICAFIGMVLFVLLTYSKAQLLVFVIMMASTLFVFRSSVRDFIFSAAVCGGIFLLIGGAVYASQSCEAPVIVQTAQPSSHVDAQVSYLQKLLAFGVFQRMAVGFPFYVHRYSNPANRCGVEYLVGRRLLGVPRPRCDMATDIFKEMWPSVTNVSGFQPAPASLSAYGELGLSWSVVVMALMGISLGALGALATAGKGSLFGSLSVAGAGFGYYLSQVPFFAAFTYPHGLIPFLAPVIVLAVAAAVRRR